MKTVDYKIVVIPMIISSDGNFITSDFDFTEFGKEGWVLCSSVRIGTNIHHTFCRTNEDHFQLKNCNIAWFIFQGSMHFRIGYSDRIYLSPYGFNEVSAYGKIRLETDPHKIIFEVTNVKDKKTASEYFHRLTTNNDETDLRRELSTCIDLIDPVLGRFDDDPYEIEFPDL